MRELVFVVLALVCVPPARAQVYEIGSAGAVQLRDGGGAVVWHDANAPAMPAQAEVPIVGDGIVSTTDQARSVLAQTAARHGLSTALLDALVWQESRWNSRAVSPKGAVGLTQLMPMTARALGVDARDPVANLDGGARYLRLLIDHFSGDVIKALAAYNAGPARVERAGGVPAIRETQGYVAAIMARLSNYVR